MTALLEKAMSQAQNLSPEEQDVVAALILEEIESEKRWDASFAGSQGQPARLAEQAITEYKAGKTKPLGPERDL